MNVVKRNWNYRWENGKSLKEEGIFHHVQHHELNDSVLVKLVLEELVQLGMTTASPDYSNAEILIEKVKSKFNNEYQDRRRHLINQKTQERRKLRANRSKDYLLTESIDSVRDVTTGQIYFDVPSAAKCLGLKSGNIHAQLRGERKRVGNHKFVIVHHTRPSKWESNDSVLFRAFWDRKSGRVTRETELADIIASRDPVGARLAQTENQKLASALSC